MATMCDYESDVIKCNNKASTVFVRFGDTRIAGDVKSFEIFTVDLCADHAREFRFRLSEFLVGYEDQHLKGRGDGK